jgi:hypothetical protein
LPLFFAGRVGATDVIGRVTSDTTWTKAQSPITLTGPVNVNTDVTLTIEPGVTVNLNNYYIQVEGTLHSVGSSSDRIRFDNGRIDIKDNSNGWNQQTGKGNVIENCFMNNVKVYAGNMLSSTHPAIKFNQNTLSGELQVSGASLVTGNTVTGTIYASDSTIVWKNTVSGSIGGGGYSSNQQNHPVFSCNTVSGSEDSGIVCSGYAQVEDNTISDCKYGISISIGYDMMGYIFAPHVTAERNKITNCDDGLHLEIYTSTIMTSGYESRTSNTISQCKTGVHASGELYGLVFKNNNIEDCADYRFYLEQGGDVNATLNWWGTTDTTAIKQSIFDSSRDFNLGTVTIEPILTAENTEAFPNQNAPMPTQQTSATPTPNPTAQSTTQATPTVQASVTPTATATPTPTQQAAGEPIFGSFNLEWAIFGALLVVIVLLSILIVLVLVRRPKSAK